MLLCCHARCRVSAPAFFRDVTRAHRNHGVRADPPYPTVDLDGQREIYGVLSSMRVASRHVPLARNSLIRLILKARLLAKVATRVRFLIERLDGLWHVSC